MNTPVGFHRSRFLPEGVAVGSNIIMGIVYVLFAEFTEWQIAIYDNILIAAHDPEESL